MSKQAIGLGSSANDGTGDTLRAGGTSINANFDEVYSFLGDGTDLLAASARSSLGLGTAATTAASDYATAAQGALADTALQPGDIDTLAELNALIGDATLIDTTDSRLSDARTPTAHAASHASGGSDALTPAAIGAATAAQGATADSALQPEDIDTLAELDAIVADATLVSTDNAVTLTNKTIAYASNTLSGLPVEIGIACSDETTDLTTGTAKATFRMPHAMTLSEVRASVTTAPVGSTLVVDINESGTTILSTKLTIDASEKTSTTAATPAVISDSALADDAEITVDIDQIGSSTAGAGLKIWLIGTRA